MESSARPQTEKLLLKFWMPLLAFVVLGVASALTPPRNPLIPSPTPLQNFAHNLGHSINSVWVGIGLILLVVPSLVEAIVYKRSNPWAWRAMDAVFLDFLVVDIMGKDLFTSLGRPGRADQPGFPSGHSTMAFLMAWLIWRRYPQLGPLWFSMAALISWSRVESHAHYPYQVMAGAIYGCALGALTVSRKTGVLFPRILLSDASLKRKLTTAEPDLTS
jgi:membrane-associated phospholipid phosphatase